MADIVWSDASAQLTVTGNDVQKTSGATDVLNGSALSQAITGDGSATVTIPALIAAAIGFGTNTAGGATGMTALIMLAEAGTYNLYEYDDTTFTYRGDGTYQAGDTITWERSGTTVTLKKNAATVTPNAAWPALSGTTRLDIAIATLNGQITNGDITGADTGGGDPDPPAGSAPTTYDLRTDSDPVIPAGWPGSSHALTTPALNEYFLDPNFGTRVWRITDGTYTSNGSSVELTGAPNNNAVASDDRHVLAAATHGNGNWAVLNFDPANPGGTSIHSRFQSGKDPGFARAASKPNIIYFSVANGAMQFQSRNITTGTNSLIFDIKDAGEHAADALVSGDDYQTEIYSSQAEDPEILIMGYGGSEVMQIGSATNGRVAITSQSPDDVAGRTVTVVIASGANAALSASDSSGALTITLGTDGTGGVASATKNTAALIRDAVDALPGWMARLPYTDTVGNVAITSARATTNLSGSGSGIQENWIYLTWINANDPTERGTIDLFRGYIKLNGGTWAQALKHDDTDWTLPAQRIHSLSIDRSGKWINIDPTGSSSHRVVWNRVTNRIHDVTNNSWLGHYCLGWEAEVNSTEDGGQPPQWVFHDYTQGGTLPTYRRLIDPAFSSPFTAHGEHSNWNNARSDALTPIFTGTGYSSFLYTWAYMQSNMKPLLGEIGSIATETGTVKGTNQYYRLCSSQMQTYDTGLNGDTDTYAADRNHFRMNQFVQALHGGGGAFFNSNWNYTLGTFGLLRDYNSSMPAGIPDYRRDVFYVEAARVRQHRRVRFRFRVQGS